jgi:hypothetical protein
VKRSKIQIYEALLKTQGIIAEMAKPDNCSRCADKDRYLNLKDERIDSQMINIVKYLKENRLLRTFIKEII